MCSFVTFGWGFPEARPVSLHRSSGAPEHGRHQPNLGRHLNQARQSSARPRHQIFDRFGQPRIRQTLADFDQQFGPVRPNLRATRCCGMVSKRSLSNAAQTRPSRHTDLMSCNGLASYTAVSKHYALAHRHYCCGPSRTLSSFTVLRCVGFHTRFPPTCSGCSRDVLFLARNIQLFDRPAPAARWGPNNCVPRAQSYMFWESGIPGVFFRCF